MGQEISTAMWVSPQSGATEPIASTLMVTPARGFELSVVLARICLSLGLRQFSIAKAELAPLFVP
jgi:hypothetical protein